MKVSDSILEGVRINKLVTDPQEQFDLVARMLTLVGLNPKFADRYPHEFLRRPAPAHLHRPGSGAEPRLYRLRRDRLRAGCVHSGSDRRLDDANSAGAGPDLHLYRP